jgi:hypothetical protein
VLPIFLANGYLFLEPLECPEGETELSLRFADVFSVMEKLFSEAKKDISTSEKSF